MSGATRHRFQPPSITRNTGCLAATASNSGLDGLIEAAERFPGLQPVFNPSPVAPEPTRGLRARVAIRLTRLARAVDPEAAAVAVRSSLEGQPEGQA